jgi:hypothetical protein
MNSLTSSRDGLSSEVRRLEAGDRRELRKGEEFMIGE